MKIAPSKARRANRTMFHRHGFALVATLSMMILLTVVAVGLLGLSSVALRSSTRTEAMESARANARVALMLAINQLQKATGPDQRITILADQRPDGDSTDQSSAATGNRHWTGAYRAWQADVNTRPDPEFLGWLVSGDPDSVGRENQADTPTTGADTVELVGAGTLGAANPNPVRVPSLRMKSTSADAPRIAWWVGDQGVKAAIATPPPNRETGDAVVRATLQGAPRNAVEFVGGPGDRAFGGLDPEDARLPTITSWNQACLLGDSLQAPRPYFHDLAPFSTGLLTNVTTGGFRKDLSMRFEQLMARSSSRRPVDPLYTVGQENGINLAELAVWYKACDPSILRTTGSYSYTTGGRMQRGTPHLVIPASAADAIRDETFHLKQPTIIAYQMILSFRVIKLNPTTNRLHLISDPVITLWNPLDVPVVMPSGQFMTVKYWQIPYDIIIRINGGSPIRAPLARSLGTADMNYLSLQIGREEQIVMKPGEVIKFSQAGDTVMLSPVGNHQLRGRKGFNYGGGFAFPLLRDNGQPIDLDPTDTITYRAQPNNQTAGQTRSSGNSTGNQTRHFSLTHHEVYLGPDRGQTAAGSLGFGGIYLDWDFGNRRLRPGEVRGRLQAGTKSPRERLYADRIPEVFEPITASKARPLSFANLQANKAPFLLLSYDAKTEFGSTSGTRSLARMNPKAHHVDFYDLSRTERDMLPYEFRAEPLVSWVNRSLDVSPDGSGFFGGGHTAQDGTTAVITHSFPRAPVTSLAALQHAFANGFEIHAPVDGYATLNGREPMMPHISHAIGNSLAPSVLPPDRIEGSLPGGRPLADHSYLANRALWDDWFFSGITPLDRSIHGESAAQKIVAEQFLSGKRTLPTTRYLPDIGTQDANELVDSMFAGNTPNDDAVATIASHMRVDGMFNVNSTSVAAWKAVLGSLKGRSVVVADPYGRESVRTASGTDVSPVTGLLTPRDVIASGDGVDVRNPDQWTGRRELTEKEIEELAVAIVSEIRRRGPFLSLADFVNRRVGNDSALARAGTIQNALDSEKVSLNRGYHSGSRQVGRNTADRFPYPDAELGPISHGIPGIIKQADILTPIAPVLAARSDSFVIRAYGEAMDSAGRVTAKAWCEAVVERGRDFVDPANPPQTATNSLNAINRDFGRRYLLVSFRWLSPSEV